MDSVLLSVLGVAFWFIKHRGQLCFILNLFESFFSWSFEEIPMGVVIPEEIIYVPQEENM